MKKFLLIAAFLLAISCSHHDQKIKLDFSLNEKEEMVGSDKAVEITTFDDRKNKEILGYKTFGEEEINLTNDQNLSELLQRKISESFVAKGFKIGEGNEIEIHLKTFRYKASRGFIIGKSDAEIAIKVVVTNGKNNEELTKNFSLSVDNKHFIAPLESTDSEIINSILQEIVRDILSDKSLLEAAVK